MSTVTLDARQIAKRLAQSKIKRLEWNERDEKRATAMGWQLIGLLPANPSFPWQYGIISTRTGRSDKFKSNREAVEWVIKQVEIAAGDQPDGSMLAMRNYETCRKAVKICCGIYND